MLEKNIHLVRRWMHRYTQLRPMLTPEQINEIHRLHWAEKWSVRKIAQQLHLGRRTIAKYLAQPVQIPASRLRSSKLDPFKPMIADWLQQDPKASAEVILQRIIPLGYQGGGAF